MEIYKLFWGELFIGTINKVDEDFPNLFGRFDISNNSLPKHIKEFVDYCIKSNELMEADEAQWLAFIEQNEYRVIDLIESGEWYLTNQSGKKEKILVPNFHNDGVVWRWDCNT